MSRCKSAFKFLALFSVLGLSGTAQAIDPSEIILTAQGAYVRALSPDKYLHDTQGGAIYGQLEKALGDKWSLGLGLSQVAFRDGAYNNYNFSSIDLVGRRWFKPWHAFNPYLQAGVGGNLFKDAFKNPWGDIFHFQLGLGSDYVLDTHWAIAYGVSYHMVAPLDTPHSYVAARLGLSYRYGTQPKVNRIAPPPVTASGVATLDEAKISQIMGKSEYTVKLGDTLYDITGRRLGKSPNLWPLVYDLNRNQIRDPNLIYPGQSLLIKKNFTPEEESAARLRAEKTPDAKP